MNITNIILNSNQITGSAEDSALIIGFSLGYHYENGKKTENPSHYKLETVLEKNHYEKIVVKVDLDKFPITEEMIAKKGGQIRVKFKNLRGKFYRTSNGEYALTCSADGLEVIG